MDIFDSFSHRLSCYLIFILFAVTRSLFHVVFKKDEDVTILCNSGLVTQRSRQQAPRVVVFSTSLSSGITEPSQSCSCVYSSHKDPYRRETWIGSRLDFRLPSPRRKRLVLKFPIINPPTQHHSFFRNLMLFAI